MPLPSSTKRSAALCSTLDGLIKILQSQKIAVAGKRFDGRTGMVATVSFFDEQQERRKVEPHLQAFKEEGGEVGPNAVGSFSVDSGEGTFAVNRLGSTQALSAIVDAVMQIWKLRDEDSAGLTGVGASPLDHAPATTEAHSGAKAETTSTNSDAIPAVHISNSLLALREHLSPSDFGWAFNDSDRERFDALTQELEATASEKLLLVHAASLARRHEFSLVHLDSTIAAVQRYGPHFECERLSTCLGPCASLELLITLPLAMQLAEPQVSCRVGCTHRNWGTRIERHRWKSARSPRPASAA